MDSGLAALLGAAIGSAATLGAAMVNGPSQARSRHAQQSRQHRRDAYARYLGALHDRDLAMDAVLAALRADHPDQAVVDELTDRFVALTRRERALYDTVKELRLAARAAIGRTA
ncbi:hypothetical protein ACIPMT_06365 [Streptomyces griseus]|uniref:hypothetical protein n=1 Tax=Streptomyces griseus TaxID=1911 RepID=UPI0037F7441D